MKKEDVLSYVDSNYVLSLTQEMVRIPTESPGETGRSKDRTPIVNLMSEHLKALGLKPNLVTVLEGRPNIIAEVKGNQEGPTLMMYSHAATIEVTDAHREQWLCDPFGAEIKDGKLYGVGSSDTKSGLAGVIGAVKAIIESGIPFKGKIILLLATGGEGGAPGGPDTLLEHNLLPKADGAILADSSDRKIVNTFKGRMLFEFVTHGKSVHSSDPKLGINAVDKMIEVVQALKKTKFVDRADPVLGEVTFTITGIEAISFKTSIPSRCSLNADMRLIPGLTSDQVVKRIQEVLDGLMRDDKELKVSVKIPRNAIKEAAFTPLENPVVQAMAKAMEKVVGRAEFLPGTMSTGAHYFLKAGIPCVFFGPGSILNAHRPNEYVDLPRIEEATKIYLLTALNFLGAKD
jgi:succinyl-diaminopimelate desuccinylase